METSTTFQLHPNWRVILSAPVLYEISQCQEVDHSLRLFLDVTFLRNTAAKDHCWL